MTKIVAILVLFAACGTDSTARDKAPCMGWMSGSQPVVGQCETACADNAAVRSAHDLGMCTASTVGDPNVGDDGMFEHLGCGYSFEFDGEIGCCVPATSKFSDVRVAFAICQ